MNYKVAGANPGAGWLAAEAALVPGFGSCVVLQNAQLRLSVSTAETF